MSEPTPSMSRDEAEEQLREWAEEHGWQIVFPNDALDADVRPGVVDAVLILTGQVRDPQGRPLRDG